MISVINTSDRPSAIAAAEILKACESSRRLIERGDYDQACDELVNVWPGPGHPPDLRGLDKRVAAEVMLASGVAEGYIGKARRIVGAQERAKDLIGASRRAFEELGLREREADAQISLAVCYWRLGGYGEAKLLLRPVLEDSNLNNDVLRLRALLWLAGIEQESGEHVEALRLYDGHADFVENASDTMRRGSFHSDRAQLLLHMGERVRDADLLSRAESDLRTALQLYAAVGHLRHMGNVQNNLGYLMSVMGRPDEAHKQLDGAAETYVALGDLALQAQVKDTRARVLMSEGRYSDAIEESAGAVTELSKCEEYGLLCDALTTHATALARAGRLEDALSAFARAKDVADERVGSEVGQRIACAMVEELTAGTCVRKGVDFDTAVHHFEEQLIRHALAASGGELKAASMRLGLRYQTLQWMLNTRHARLLPERSEIKPRRRSIVKKPAKVLKYEKKGA